MIILYDRNETDFTHNGLGVLNECLVAEVQEELNGGYSLYIEYPILTRKGQLITDESIIKAPTPKGDQLFRVNRVVKNMGPLKVYANHIFFDLGDNFIEEVNITLQNGLDALQQLLASTQYSHNFTSFSDIEAVKDTTIIRKTPLEALLSNDENSFINLWGGELDRNNFDVRMMVKIGEDRGVAIRYGKNLTGIEEDLQSSDVITRIMPIGANGLILPEKYVDSPLINAYTKPKIAKIDFGNVGVDENTTQEEAYEMLRVLSNAMYTVNKVDIPKVNYRVNFQELSKTEEYKNYAILERVYLGDTVTINHERIGIDIKAKFIGYKWDCLLAKYTEIQLGNFKDNITSTILSNISKAIDTINQNMDTLEISVLQRAKDNATEQINAGLGGYVLKRHDEILIMDTDDVNTAQKIWRWNKNGLGYSSTGYNGPYGTAMTSDGAIVADFITTGVMDANKVTINNLIVGNNVAMGPNATIKWGQVTDLGSEFTYIDQNGVYTGALSAEQVNAVDIKVSKLTAGDGTSKVVISGDGVVQVSTMLYGLTSTGGIGLGLFPQVGIVKSSGVQAMGDNSTYSSPDTSTMALGKINELKCNWAQVGNSGASGEGLIVMGYLTVVSGTKNCVERTQNHGDVLISAYETPTSHYGDIGEGVIQNGSCICFIDPILSEVISPIHKYQVFTQKYTEGEITKIDRFKDYFVVYGTEGLEFAWEIKCRRINHENERFERFTELRKDGTPETNEQFALTNEIISQTKAISESERQLSAEVDAQMRDINNVDLNPNNYESEV